MRQVWGYAELDDELEILRRLLALNLERAWLSRIDVPHPRGGEVN